MLSESDPDGLLFMDLCRKGDIEKVTNMLENRFDPNSYLNYQNWSPLFIAVKYNQIEIVKLLISYKANVNQATLNQDTPLMHAALNNNLEMLKLLVENGSNINDQNDEGGSALSNACYYGYKQIVEYLLKKENTKKELIFKGLGDIGQTTPQQIAQIRGFKDISLLFQSKL